tara:strand:- start:366 stop:1343 length:978 start_codon:yes stop_codon:yes gene_type:complete
MFYTSYGNIKKDNNKCKISSDVDILKINQTKEKVRDMIYKISLNYQLEDVNQKILIKLINQDIDSYYDIYNKSDKKFYDKKVLSEKISEKSLRIEINRLLNLIINKSNFYITPQIKSKNTNVIPQKEGGVDVTLQVAIRSLISLGEKVSNENFLEFNDKIILIESSLIRLHHAYHIFENSEQKDADLQKLKNTRKLIAASVKMGIILEYGYFKNWQDGLEQTAISLIKPFRFKNQVLKIKRKGDILYYLLPSYKNYNKCIFEENIKNINKINEQVNISLLKIFSQKDNKDEFYKDCQEFKDVEIETFEEIKNGLFYQANGKLSNY